MIPEIRRQHNGFILIDIKLNAVTAAKEVILCSGPIGTHHLLLVSDIGPSASLNQVGLEIHVNLIVGVLPPADNYQELVRTLAIIIFW